MGIDQEYQLDVITDPSDRIIINKSRSIGISYAIAFKKLIDALTTKRQYIFGSVRKENAGLLIKYVDEFYNDLEKLIEGLPKKKSNTKDEISFTNGSLILSLPNDPKSFRTWHGDVWLDEYAFYFDDKETMKSVKGCLKPPPKHLILSSTPNGQQGEFYRIYKGEIENPKTTWSIKTIPYDVCTIKGFKEAIEREKEEAILYGMLDDWEQEYNCKFVDESTRLFPWHLISSCVTNKEIKGKVKYIGIDFGQKVDETVIRGVGDDGEGNIKVLWKHCISKEGYTSQIDIIKTLIKANPEVIRVWIDKTGLGIRLEEELKESDIGYLIEGMQFNNERKEKMAMFFYSLLTAGRIELPNDEKLLKQIHGIERTKTDTGMTRYRHENHKHDDEFWALCLALTGYMDTDNNNDDIKISVTGESKFRRADVLAELNKGNGRRSKWSHMSF